MYTRMICVYIYIQRTWTLCRVPGILAPGNPLPVLTMALLSLILMAVSTNLRPQTLDLPTIGLTPTVVHLAPGLKMILQATSPQ